MARPRQNPLDVLPYRALLRASRWEDRKRMVMALYESGRSEAAHVLRQALQDSDERIRLLAAQALERLSEKSEKAIQAARLRVETQPENPLPRLDLARLLYDRVERAGHSAETERAALTEASLHINAVLPRLSEPRLTSARLQLGRIYAKLSQPEDAITVLSEVSSDAPDHPYARHLIAEMRLLQGDIAGCRHEMENLSRFPLRNGVKGSVAYWTARS